MFNEIDKRMTLSEKGNEATNYVRPEVVSHNVASFMKLHVFECATTGTV